MILPLDAGPRRKPRRKLHRQPIDSQLIFARDRRCSDVVPLNLTMDNACGSCNGSVIPAMYRCHLCYAPAWIVFNCYRLPRYLIRTWVPNNPLSTPCSLTIGAGVLQHEQHKCQLDAKTCPMGQLVEEAISRGCNSRHILYHA